MIWRYSETLLIRWKNFASSKRRQKKRARWASNSGAIVTRPLSLETMRRFSSRYKPQLPNFKGMNGSKDTVLSSKVFKDWARTVNERYYSMFGPSCWKNWDNYPSFHVTSPGCGHEKTALNPTYIYPSLLSLSCRPPYFHLTHLTNIKLRETEVAANVISNSVPSPKSKCRPYGPPQA